MKNLASFLFVTVAVAVTYFPWLWGYSLPLTGDQKIYLSVAREMFERGSWLTPYLFGEACFLKPPFHYWLTLLGWKLFGINLFGAYFFGVLALIGSSALLPRLWRAMGMAKGDSAAGSTGWMAVLLPASVGAMTFATTAQMEIDLLFLYALAWWLGLRFTQSLQTRDLFLAFVVAGALGWVKSPIYSMFWVLGFGFFLVTAQTSLFWKTLARPGLWISLALAGGISVAWYILMYRQYGEVFWASFILREHLEKKGGNGSHFWIPWTGLIYFAVPWTLLTVAGGIRWVARATPREMLLVLAFAAPLALFFTYYPYRVSTYLFPLLPILLGMAWTGWVSVWARRATAVVIAVGVPLLPLGLWWFHLIDGVDGKVFGILVVFGVAGILFCRWLWRGEVRAVVAALVLVATMRCTAVYLGERELAPMRAILRQVPDRGLVLLEEQKNIWGEAGLLSVALGRTVLRARSTEEWEKAVGNGAIGILNADQTSRPGFPSNRVQLTKAEWPRFQRRSGISIHQLYRIYEVWLKVR